MLLGAAGSVVAVAQLSVADISIDLRESAVSIEASYYIADAPDPIRFTMIRLRGQSVRMVQGPAAPSAPELRDTGGLYEFAVAPAEDGEAVRIAYQVTGNLDRIPLFIPSTPTDPAISDITIRVLGVDAGIPARGGFPRLERTSNGALVARPENLPSFVTLPPPRGRWTASSIADGFVALLVLLASSYWFLWRRSVRRARGIAG